jgi:predicted flap endonuclease-1-like 5' DNA nuclease/predicted RNase H-like nuclease (RuvC/YqgF family)
MDTMSFLYGLIGGMAAVIAADFFFYRRGKNALSEVESPSAFIHSNPELELQLESARSEIERLKLDLETARGDSNASGVGPPMEPDWPDQRLIVAQLEERVRELESAHQTVSSNDSEGQASDQRVQALEQELAGASAEAEASKAELASAKEELERARAELVRIVTGGEPSSTPSVDYEEIVAAKDAAISSLKKKVEELSAAHSPSLDFAAKIEERDAQIRLLEDRVAELLQQAQNAQDSGPAETVAAPEELMVLKMQLQALQEELQSREIRIVELESAAEPASAAGDPAPVLSSKIADLEDELEAKNRELSGLKQKLADAHEASNSGGSRKLAELDAELVTLRSQLANRDNEISRLKRDLQDAQRFYDGEMPTPSPVSVVVEEPVSVAPAAAPSAPAPSSVATQAMTLAQQLAGGAKPQAAPATGQGGFARVGRDPLQSIEGIGPVYQAKLWEAGIHRFADLAGLTPQQVIEIIQPKEWQHIDAEIWIEEAKRISSEG